MSTTIYGDGTLYGDADAFYGRIAAALLDAQTASLRSTGLKVSVVDERVNRWEMVNDVGAIDTTIYNGVSSDPKLASYSAYRGRASVVKLDNGNIIRVRIGTPSSITDRQLYTQTITDPTVAAQWQSWTLLYSGNHLAVHLAKTGANTYDIYHTKLGAGLFKNNSLLWASSGEGVLLEGIELYGLKGAGTDYSSSDYLVIQVPGAGLNNRRKLDFYIMTSDGSQPWAHQYNFEWYRHTMGIVKKSSTEWVAIRSFPLHQNPRIEQNGESITTTIVPAGNIDSVEPDAQAPRIIRGLGGRAGFNIITMGGVDKLSDGYYYVFYHEFHRDDDWQVTQSSPFLFWQRSKDALHWSEPVITGFTVNGWAGLFEHDGWLYLAGNGHVIRRPMTSVTHDITNYVPHVTYELPRENAEGSGQVMVANPAGVNDGLLNLSDRRIIIEPGIRVEGGSYEFARTGDFWIKRVQQETKNQASRLVLEIGDVWSRISQPLRDTFNVIGKTEWEDWKTGKVNEAFNYYFDGGEAETTADFKLSSSGLCLWTGWKGHNPKFSVTFNTKPITFYARWKDDKNYIMFEYDGSTLTVRNVVDDLAHGVATWNVGSSVSRFTIDIKWRDIVVKTNTGGSFNAFVTNSDELVLQPGYVGWKASNYQISNFVFEDWEDNVTTHDIVKYALAMGDYHDVIVGGPSEKQYAMIWGPQTDIPTAADGLRQVLEAVKLELIWRDGRIEVGQFTGEEPYKTLENEIFETGYTDEAGRRINFAVVDGNEHSWLQADEADSRARDRQIVAYYDIPELVTADAVKERAIEEIRRSAKGQSPTGRIPLLLDLWRMDAIAWTDNMGRVHNIRLEGIRVTISQNERPSQYMELDSSLL